MKGKMMAKFKVGDWANFKGGKLEGMGSHQTKVHILEVTTHKCEAGIVQTSYLCRSFVKDLKYGWSPSIKENCYREIELEKLEKERENDG